MFPIFRMEPTSSGQTSIAVVGTGFFINSVGNFASVAHVFDNATPQTKYFYFGLIPDKLENPPLEITETIRDNNKDIYIGKIHKRTEFLTISSKKPSIGRTVCIGGYPLAEITNNTQGGIELGGVRKYYQPSFILDHAIGTILNRTHEGFLVRDFGLFGMSGGPVFDTSGAVVGIQGSVTNPRISVSGDGRTISVENALAIKSELLIDLAKSHSIRLN